MLVSDSSMKINFSKCELMCVRLDQTQAIDLTVRSWFHLLGQAVKSLMVSSHWGIREADIYLEK